MAMWVNPKLTDYGLSDDAPPVSPVTPVGTPKSDPGPYINDTIWTLGGRCPSDWGSIELSADLVMGNVYTSHDDFFVTADEAHLSLAKEGEEFSLNHERFSHFLTDVDGLGSHGFRRCF